MNLAHPDFELLFDWLVKMSKTLLNKQGAFLPHGAIVTTDGKLAGVGASTKEAQPGAQRALQVLEDGLRGIVAKGICRASGVAIDTRLKAAPRKEDVGRDAIWLMLEEEGGLAQGVIMPYTKSWLGGYTYGEAYTQPEKPRIFGTSKQ